ncbi:hypothetical protein H1R20_g6892, partial [Candolleomyces eurysporus]
MNSRPIAAGVQVETVSPAELYEVITGACSQDQARVQASGKRLKEMLEMFGTYSGLHEIASQRNYPLPIRLQAIIQFKLTALNHWKSRKLLSDAQRIEIRNRCLGMLDETDDSIAQFNTVITAKISRHDFPSNWPNLITDLMTVIDNNLQKRYVQNSSDPRDALMLRRSLQLVNAILKELASIKMMNGVKVMANLSNQFAEFVTPLLLATFEQVALQPTLDLPAILQKEALYCAIGRCAVRLKDRLPFAEWLEKTLAVEALSQDPKFPIIKRRIAWLIGKWVSEQCSSPNNPRIWEILVHLLKDRSDGTDTVVRLTAANAVKDCVDTLEFSAEVFAPFLLDTITELVRLMDEADTSESKRRIATTLSAVLEQTKDMVTPFMGIIAEPVPQLWTAAGEDWLLKGTMLTTVTKLVEAVKDRSSALESITVPLIQESLSPGVMINLDEDGLILWLAAIRNAPSGGNRNGPQSLLAIYPRALYLLATNLDLLGKITGILESYFFLDAPALLQNYSKDIFQAFTEGLKSQAVMVNMKDMVVALQFMVQLAPSNLWGEPMHTSGLFAHLLLTLNDGESSPILLTEIIFLFSRIVMADAQMFLQLMSATAPAVNQPETNLWEGLLDQWWGKFDNMSEPRHRKLTAMGTATLVATGRPEVLKRLSGEIFNLWLDVFGEIKETRLLHEEDPTNLELVSPTNLRRHWELDEAPRDYYQDSEGTPEFDRRKALYDRDPIRVVQLNEYVRAHLGQAEAVVGPNFQVYLKDADPTVLEQIQAELKS